MKFFGNSFKGVPPFWPLKGPPKMSTPALPMTPLFQYRILFYSKTWDVCKQTELKMLRFDQDMRVLSLNFFLHNFQK